MSRLRKIDVVILAPLFGRGSLDPREFDPLDKRGVGFFGLLESEFTRSPDASIATNRLINTSWNLFAELSPSDRYSLLAMKTHRRNPINYTRVVFGERTGR